MKVTLSKDKKTLVIEMPIQKLTPSASGKTLIACSTSGNKKTGVMIEGKELVLGVNGYVYPDEE